MRLATVGASFSSAIIIGLGTFVWLPVATCAIAICRPLFLVRSAFQRDLLPLVEYTARKRIPHGNSIEIKIDEGGGTPFDTRNQGGFSANQFRPAGNEEKCGQKRRPLVSS